MRSILHKCAFVLIALFVAAHFNIPSALARNDYGAAAEKQAIQVIVVAELPHEARETLKLIRQGGPFPYERDGVVFGNFEKRLPIKERGYYREYTVNTPGEKHRGARRIVAGRCAPDSDSRSVEREGAQGAARNARDTKPKGSKSGQYFTAPCSAGELYYTDDHYQSFKQIR